MGDLAGAQKQWCFLFLPIVREPTAFKVAVLRITLCKERRLSLSYPFATDNITISPQKAPWTSQDFIPVELQNMAARQGTPGHALHHIIIHPLIIKDAMVQQPPETLNIYWSPLKLENCSALGVRG